MWYIATEKSISHLTKWSHSLLTATREDEKWIMENGKKYFEEITYIAHNSSKTIEWRLGRTKKTKKFFKFEYNLRFAECAIISGGCSKKQMEKKLAFISVERKTKIISSRDAFLIKDCLWEGVRPHKWCVRKISS